MTRAAYAWHAPKTTVAGLRGHEPYTSALTRYLKRDDVAAIPEELEEIVTAEMLGMSLQQLRETPWEDVMSLMAYQRGRQIAGTTE